MHRLKAPLLALILIAPLCFGTGVATTITLKTADDLARAHSALYFPRLVLRDEFDQRVHNREWLLVDNLVLPRTRGDLR